MKKPETIQKWVDEERPGAVAEAVAKTALDGGYGLVASIAWAIGDGPVVAATSAGKNGYDQAIERALIEGFFGELERLRADSRVSPTLVGHCISSFDVLFLWRRAIVLGIAPPSWWPVHAAPWKADDLQDTMLMWCGPKGGFISQDRLARILGLKGKGDIDGSKVAALWEAGRYEDVRIYNADDVECCRRIWCRLTGEEAPDDESEGIVLATQEAEDEVMQAVVAKKGLAKDGQGRVIPSFLLGVTSTGRAA
ncbi:hypothetical protein [Aureimonas mangrovi]|uniref:hypothetical protein n=1 Tax=Aureimonas mangrovi TaxID=2758041 RepID=UPI001FE5BD42|nr:hypothetical protein [Aureimonas mangrovi]